MNVRATLWPAAADTFTTDSPPTSIEVGMLVNSMSSALMSTPSCRYWLLPNAKTRPHVAEHQGVLQTHRRVDDLLLLTVPRVQLEQRRGESRVRVLRARGPHSELPAVVPPPDVYVFLLLSGEVNNGALVQRASFRWGPV